MNKIEKVEARCTAEQKNLIQAKANARGLSLSAYVLMTLLNDNRSNIITPEIRFCLESITYHTQQLLNESDSLNAILLGRRLKTYGII